MIKTIVNGYALKVIMNFQKDNLGFKIYGGSTLNEAAPYDNKPIILSDTFFESVAIKDIEKQLYDLRNLYYEVNEKK